MNKMIYVSHISNKYAFSLCIFFYIFIFNIKILYRFLKSIISHLERLLILSKYWTDIHKWNQNDLKDFSIESKIVFEVIYHCHFKAAKTWQAIISCMHDFSITPRQNGDKDSRKFHLDMAINSLRFKDWNAICIKLHININDFDKMSNFLCNRCWRLFLASLMS